MTKQTRYQKEEFWYTLGIIILMILGLIGLGILH
jgi:hypothetical protein